jgi:hypothetical protein
MADRVHATMNPMEPSLLGPVLRRPLRQADATQLLETCQSVLALGQL